MAGRKKVVVTGVGAVTALAHSIESTFEKLCAGQNAIVEIPYLKEAGFPVYIGGLVPDLETLEEAYPESREHHSRKLAYLLKSADEALGNAGLSHLGGYKAGVFLGVETSRLPLESAFRIFQLSGRESNRVDYQKFGALCQEIVSADQVQNKQPSFLSRFLAARFGVTGPVLATSNACASSNYAMGAALRKLRSGEIDVAITGSADEMIDPYIVMGFHLLTALSTCNSEPSKAIKPFDVRRDGFVLGEGGAILVLETAEHARRRGAPVLCELAGFGSTSDGEKITACNRQGSWLQEAMKRAIEDGGMTLEDIGYINAHGTSTRLNDLAESRAITALFGDHAKNIVVNATKSMIGHAVAAAGAIEAAVTVLSLDRGVCHPTRNLEVRDKECELNYGSDGPVQAKLVGAISNSCGFSGGNTCVAFRKLESCE